MSDVELGGGGMRDLEFTNVTSESYGSRMKNACCGVFMGILLFFGSMGLLFWNEGRNIKTQRDLDEGQELVVETSVANLTATKVVTSTDENSIVNKLIHVTGPVTTPSALVDPIFGVSTGTGNSSAALKLKRFVEMYQWQESSTSETVKTKNGGTRTETTYSYDKTWSSWLIDSDSFNKKQAAVENPKSFPFDPLELEADPILLGNVTLSSPIVSRLNWYEPVSGVSISDIPDAQIRQQVTTYSNSGFYYGNGTTNAAPSVGDTRITFEAVEADTVSIIALFTGDSLTPYTTSRGGTLLLVKRGTFSADELFVQAEEENEQLTWILRFVGFLIMFLSILIMLQPISTAVDIIPFVGDCLEGGLEKCVFPTIAFLIALPVSAFVMALGWLWYRPVIAVPIVVVSFALSVWLCIRARNKKNEHDQQQQQQQQQQGPSTTTAYGKPTAAQPYGGEPETYSYAPQQPTSTSLAGFAQALDNPPPFQQQQQQEPSIPVTTGVPIVTAQPSAPAENDVYVPQTFKP